MMKKEYLAIAQHAYQVEQKKWVNVRAWNEINKRVYSTEKEARDALSAYIAEWNRDFEYGADGKRTETQACGMIGVDIVSRKEDDDMMRVVAWKIRVREVSDWEEVDAG